MLKLGKGHQAKQCFMEALALDIKCYEAFEQLITSEMMNPTEGGDLTISFNRFINRLVFRVGICTRTRILCSSPRRC